ncbi:hypothetical protein [Metapseudomonas otitidis]|uniref:hypothetical protein n=1 Tax=Metapseudomonas otitidis TaxID=319939 RepID=UPI001F374684|nr:hypothetical protein [Pseudomonas otitidis]
MIELMRTSEAYLPFLRSDPFDCGHLASFFRHVFEIMEYLQNTRVFTRHTADESSVNLTNFYSLNSCPHYWAESHCISLALKEWLVRYLSIVYHGAVKGITDSCHQLQMDDEHTPFIDCLLFQGAEVSLEGRAGASRSVIDFSPYMPYKQTLSLIDTQQLNACIRLQRADHILGSPMSRLIYGTLRRTMKNASCCLAPWELSMHQSSPHPKPYIKPTFWSSKALTAMACVKTAAAGVRDRKKYASFIQDA